jgi:folate-binding protein YgfZ
MTLSPQYSALTDHVCVEARGRDAGAYLHGQLSQAVADLDATRAPLAAWHDARGRVRALLRVFRLPERWLLVGPRDGAEPLLKKLRMFVLRAAVTLDIANDVAVAAVLDADDTWLRGAGVPPDTRPNRVITNDGVRFVRVGDTYWQALGDTAALAPLARSLPPASLDAAALAEIRLGIPAITTSLAERFVAQMLNLDELGAVSFDKGCYPGQEIVARLHNLGGVKRRLRRYSTVGPPAAIGTAILTADGNGTAVGEVVRSAPAGSGSELLAIVDNAAADAPLATSAGAALHALALPFFVPRD